MMNTLLKELIMNMNFGIKKTIRFEQLAMKYRATGLSIFCFVLISLTFLRTQ